MSAGCFVFRLDKAVEDVRFALVADLPLELKANVLHHMLRRLIGREREANEVVETKDFETKLQ